MNSQKPFRTNDPTEAVLHVYRRHLIGELDSGNPYLAAVSESDLDAMQAYVEGRMRRREARTFRRRLTRTPALQRELGAFIDSIRDTDYGQEWLNGGAVASSSARAGWWSRCIGAFHPQMVAPFAVGVAVTGFALYLTMGPEWGRVRSSPTSPIMRQITLAPDRDLDRGDLSSASQGYLTILRENKESEPIRQAAQAKYVAVTQVRMNDLMRDGQFDEAVRVAGEALAVVPNEPLILAQAGDAELMRMRGHRLADPATAANPFADYQEVQIGSIKKNDLFHTRSLKPTSPSEAQKKAIDYYHQALKADPKNVRALVGLGEIYLDLGDLDSANKSLGLARQTAPNDPRVQNILGRLFVQKGREELAVKAFEEALRLEPNNPTARYSLQALQQSGLPSLPPIEISPPDLQPGNILRQGDAGPAHQPHPLPPGEPKKPNLLEPLTSAGATGQSMPGVFYGVSTPADPPNSSKPGDLNAGGSALDKYFPKKDDVR